jgi:hypothetical protein
MCVQMLWLYECYERGQYLLSLFCPVLCCPVSSCGGQHGSEVWVIVRVCSRGVRGLSGAMWFGLVKSLGRES